MNNPPAFPAVITEDHVEHNEGMTLRDYFAIRFAVILYDKHGKEYPKDGLCGLAYLLANEMLKAREQP